MGKTFAVFEGVQLKVDDALEWTGRMDNIQACAREFADREMIINKKSRKA